MVPTDATNEILKVRGQPEWRLILLPERAGKSNALNQAVRQARNEILIFSDASTLFSPEALQKLVRHFSDPRIGVVCGSLQFQGTTESKQTEGIFWKYESMLRLMEGSRRRHADSEWGDLRTTPGLLPPARFLHVDRGFRDSDEGSGGWIQSSL